MQASPIPVSADNDLSRPEVRAAADYLTTTRDAVVQAVEGLAPAQATFKPGPDRWSIGDIVEHLTLLEELFLEKVVVRLLSSPVSVVAHDVERADARIVRLERDPSTAVVEWGRVSLAEAPPPLAPRGRWTLDEALARFRASREGTIQVLEATRDLRQHVVEQPALGPLDGYQWLLFVAAHTERHARQIADVKEHPDFPR